MKIFQFYKGLDQCIAMSAKPRPSRQMRVLHSGLLWPEDCSDENSDQLENFVEGVEHVGTEEVVEVHQVFLRKESRENSDCSTDLLHTQIARIEKFVKIASTNIYTYISYLGFIEIKLNNSPDVGVSQHDQKIWKSTGEFRPWKNVDG